MSSNSAYEPDKNDDRPSAPQNATANTQNGRTPNENTSLNLHLDTYFSEARIPIPEKVSSLGNKINHGIERFYTCLTQISFIRINRKVLVFANYGHSQDRVS